MTSDKVHYAKLSYHTCQSLSSPRRQSEMQQRTGPSGDGHLRPPGNLDFDRAWSCPGPFYISPACSPVAFMAAALASVQPLHTRKDLIRCSQCEHLISRSCTHRDTSVHIVNAQLIVQAGWMPAPNSRTALLMLKYPLCPLLFIFMSNYYVELKQARSGLAKKRRSSSAERHVSRPGSFARPAPPVSIHPPDSRSPRATRPAVASLSRLQGITWSGAFRRNSPAKASTPQLN